MQRNRYKDYLAIPVLNSWAAVFRGSATSDYYMEPLTAPLEWWQGLPVQRGLLLAGEDEVLFDDIQKFSRVFTTVEVSFCPVENEPHDHLVMEFSLDEPRSKQREIFEEWVCGIVCR